MMTFVGLFLTTTCAATVLDRIGEPHNRLRDVTGLCSGGVTGTAFLIPSPSEDTYIA